MQQWFARSHASFNEVFIFGKAAKVAIAFFDISSLYVYIRYFRYFMHFAVVLPSLSIFVDSSSSVCFTSFSLFSLSFFSSFLLLHFFNRYQENLKKLVFDFAKQYFEQYDCV